NVDLTLTHPDGSKWYEWLVGVRPVHFWSDPADPSKRIYLLGNPVVWAIGTAGVAAAIAFATLRRARLLELMAADPSSRERSATQSRPRQAQSTTTEAPSQSFRTASTAKLENHPPAGEAAQLAPPPPPPPLPPPPPPDEPAAMAWLTPRE